MTDDKAPGPLPFGLDSESESEQDKYDRLTTVFDQASDLPIGHFMAQAFVKLARENPSRLELAVLNAQIIASGSLNGDEPNGLNVRDLAEWVSEPEPDHRYLVSGLIEVGANVLMAGPPKAGKTLFAQHVALRAAAGLSVAGRYAVSGPIRTMVVLTEGTSRAHKRRFHRLYLGGGSMAGVKAAYRPRLKFSDPGSMSALRDEVEDHDTDLLVLDHWTSLSGGVDSNNADAVQAGLGALDLLRDAQPDLCIALIHHAAKNHEGSRKTITDTARGSTAFGAWYDTGMLFSKNEKDAIYTAKVEHRELPAPQDILFTLRDEGHDDNGPTGYLKLVAEDAAMDQIAARNAETEGKIKAALMDEPNSSEVKLWRTVAGNKQQFHSVLANLIDHGKVEVRRHGQAKLHRWMEAYPVVREQHDELPF